MLEIEFPFQMTTARISQPKNSLGKCPWTPLEHLMFDGEILIKLIRYSWAHLSLRDTAIMLIILATKKKSSMASLISHWIRVPIY